MHFRRGRGELVLSCVPKQALAIPAEADQVKECSGQALQVRILRLAVPARMVIHRDLHDTSAVQLEVGGEKAMRAIEWRNVMLAFSLEGLEAAPRIPNAIARDPVANGIANAGCSATRPIVAAVCPVATGNITVLKCFDKQGDVAGVVLQVPIHKDDHVPVGAMHALQHGIALPPVFRDAQNSKVGISRCARLDLLPGVVAAAVVDQHNFEVLQFLLELGKTFDKGLDVL